MSDEYKDAVEADAPALWWRMREEGASSDGDEIQDWSGNDEDGTLTDSTGDAYGWPSPIETDPVDKSFRARRLQPEGTSYIERDPGPDMSSGAWAIETWAYFPSGVSSGFGDSLFGRGSELQLRRAHEPSPSPGAANFRLSARATRPDLSFDEATAALDIFLNTWYHLVVVHDGVSLLLYVNGTLAITAATVSTLNSSNDPLRAGTSAAVQADFLLNNMALYDGGLSGSRVLAHYEAALNTLDMRGRCDIRITAALNGDTSPDPEAFDFRHNWSSNFVERLSGRTSVFLSKNRTAQLASQRSAPRRELDYSVLLRDEHVRRRFYAKSFVTQSERWYFPVRPYEVRVDIAAGSSSAAFDTRFADYDAGRHAMLWSADYSQSQVVTLTEVTTGGVEWDELAEFDASWITPARRGYMQPSLSLRGHTSVVEEVDVTARLLAEDEPLSPNRVTPWTPQATHEGYELFRPQGWQSNDYSEAVDIEVLTETDLTDFETGVFSQRTDAPGSEGLRSYRMILEGWEAIAKFLGWWYYRRGQAVPFWMPSFQSDLTPVSLLGSVLTVSGHLYTSYYNLNPARRDLVFVYNDSTIAYRRITAVTTSGANDQLTLSGGSGTVSLSNLRYVCFLKLGHLGADQLEIAWETNTVARIVFTFAELGAAPAVSEASASRSPSASVSASVSPSVSPSASLSPSASVSPSASSSPSASVSPSA